MQVILPEQKLLENSEQWTAILAYIPDPGLRDKLNRAWSNGGKGCGSDDLSVARWNELVQELPSMSQVCFLQCTSDEPYLV